MSGYEDYYRADREAKERAEEKRTQDIFYGAAKVNLSTAWPSIRVCPTCSAALPDNVQHVTAHMNWHTEIGH